MGGGDQREVARCRDRGTAIVSIAIASKAIASVPTASRAIVSIGGVERCGDAGARPNPIPNPIPSPYPKPPLSRRAARSSRRGKRSRLGRFSTPNPNRALTPDPNPNPNPNPIPNPNPKQAKGLYSPPPRAPDPPQTSVVSTLFEGQLLSSVQCCACSQVLHAPNLTPTLILTLTPTPTVALPPP